MARSELSINIDVERLKCFDEGDGIGNAEPYLWTVFFKVDGSTISVAPSLTLAGNATIHTTPGSHGNLGDTDVDAGDTVNVPSSIGEWSTNLQPIPFQPPLDGLDPLGGVIGVVCVLMEEDNVSDAGADAGHAALNTAVEAAVNQIVATRTVTNQDVSDEELAGFEASISQKVTDAIAAEQSFFENIWSWLNPDDTVGFKVFLFKHDDLAQQGSINFSQRFQNEGDWELSGNVTATPVCTIDLFDVLFASDGKAMSAEGAGAQKLTNRIAANKAFDIDALRKFRETSFRKLPGLTTWWSLALRNTPAIARVLANDAELRAKAAALVAYAAETCNSPKATLDPKQLTAASELLESISGATSSRRLRIDAARAADVVPHLTGHTVASASKGLSAVLPARRPLLAKLKLRRPPTKPAARPLEPAVPVRPVG